MAGPEVIVRFDGSSLGNPGPSGHGIALFHTDGTLIECCGTSSNVDRTCNESEYVALYNGCVLALVRGYKRIAIEGDSLLVCRQVTGRWKINSQRLRNLADDVLRVLSKFDSWTITHIDRSLNSVADSMARQYSAISQKKVLTPPSTSP